MFKNLFTFIVLLTLSFSGHCTLENHASRPIHGDWSGILDVGLMQLTLVLHVEENEEGLKAQIDSLEQGLKGFPVDVIHFENESLNFKIHKLIASYEGSFNNATHEIIGNFTQKGISFPLTFKRGTAETTLNRPQYPQPPFPYFEEEVSFENKQAGVTLSGTLTRPKKYDLGPVVYLIAGSGPNDRNETVFGHQPFLVLADHLTREGMAVLRVDKRGVGKSTGNYDLATSEDFASDVFAGIDYLKTRQDINHKKLGLLGHSEGGMIAPMVAAVSTDVAYTILMAGPGVNCQELLLEQIAAVKLSEGISAELITRENALIEQMLAIVKNSQDFEVSQKQLWEVVKTYLANLPETLKTETEFAKESLTEGTIKRINTPWFRFFLNYEPATALKKIKTPVLAINGELDLQVSSKQNLPMIAQALKEAGNQNFTIIEIPGVNHLFQSCKTGSIKEYAKIEETISPDVLHTLSKWILERVSNE